MEQDSKMHTTSELFIERFIRKMPNLKLTQKTPTQIYPLKLFLDNMIVPFPMIKSSYNILIYINKGEYEEQIEAQMVNVNSSSLIYIPSGATHAVQKMASDIDGYFLLIEDKVLSAILNSKMIFKLSLIQPLIELSEKDSMWIKQLCDMMFDELDRDNPNRYIGEGLVLALLSKAIELSNNAESISRNAQIALQFKNLVNIHYKEQRNIEFYASKLAISTNYLNRCIQSTYNKRAKQLILEITIVKSQLMMLDFSKDTSEICFELNFEDASYFSRLFKKIIGMSPREYRQTLMHTLS